MPPKKKQSDTVITILKLKRLTTTYILTVDSNTTVENIRNQLANIIEQSGGLKSAEEEVQGADVNEDDIEIPKSEYIDEVEVDSDIKQDDEDNDVIKIESNEIRLGVPKDTSDPYANNWNEIIDGKDLLEFNFKDYDILAFAYGPEESFDIAEPAFEEN